MSRIRGKNTAIEIRLRQALYARGFRYRLHVKHLPGRPDVVFLGRKSVIFLNGCFWHGHACDLFRHPKTNADFWDEKIVATIARDAANREALRRLGWRCLTVWECAMRGRGRLPFEKLIEQVVRWLEDGESGGSDEVKGDATPLA